MFERLRFASANEWVAHDLIDEPIDAFDHQLIGCLTVQVVFPCMFGEDEFHSARSGKHNIAEGCMASGTSKKTELKLIGIARASLEELLVDFQDYMRQHNLPLWGKDHPKAKEVRGLCYKKDRSYLTYKTYIEASPPEIAANTMICVIHQANYLLDQQLRSLEK